MHRFAAIDVGSNGIRCLVVELGEDGTPRILEIVANVARYHRRRHPTRKHPPFVALAEEDREIVRRLAAILRVADVLDREHRQLVRGVRADIGKRRVRLHVDADGDLLLERWAADRKFGLFEEVFELEVGIEG